MKTLSFSAYLEQQESLDEGFFGDFFGGAKQAYTTQYQQAQQGVANSQNFEKYASVAQQAIAKVGNAAKFMSQKTGVPLPLATALMAAGLTGGATAVPFAALLYFVKQPLMKGANKAFDATWDAGAKAVQGVQNAFQGQPQGQPQVQPATESFRHYVETRDLMEADNFASRAGQAVGGFAGRVAGNVMGYGQKIGSAIGGRIKEIYQFAKNNPKEVARFAFLVGAGAAIGAGVGKLTHDVKDYIVQKIQDYGVPAEELNWLRQHVVLDAHVDKHGQSMSTGEVMVNEPGHHNDGGGEIGDIWSGRVTTGESDVAKHTYGGGQPDVSHRGVIDYTGTDGTTNGIPDGRVASFDASYEAPSQGAAYKDLGSAYRAMAHQMHDLDQGNSLGMMQHLQGLEQDPTIAQTLYGHSAAEEIRKRLASPDNFTVPGATTGAIVGNNNRRQS